MMQEMLEKELERAKALARSLGIPEENVSVIDLRPAEKTVCKKTLLILDPKKNTGKMMAKRRH